MKRFCHHYNITNKNNYSNHQYHQRVKTRPKIVKYIAYLGYSKQNKFMHSQEIKPRKPLFSNKKLTVKTSSKKFLYNN